VKNIAIFASGTGTNAENLIRYFSTRNSAKVILVLSNKSQAPVLERAANLGVSSIFFDRHEFYETDSVLEILKNNKIDIIILAGFLWFIPEYLTREYAGRIINIHPALLPSYGGKGMYGDKVHAAVLDAGEQHSGITIHYVNDFYDAGDIIFQAQCDILPGDDIHSLAARVHKLEYEHFPTVVESVILKMK
jgi:phosphoribosylglycinamide formyltransferase 1